MEDETERSLGTSVPLAWDAHHAPTWAAAPFYASKKGGKEHRKRKPWLAATATLCFALPHLAGWVKDRRHERGNENRQSSMDHRPEREQTQTVPEVQRQSLPIRTSLRGGTRADSGTTSASASLHKILSVARTSAPLVFDRDLVLARVDEVVAGLDRVDACLGLGVIDTRLGTPRWSTLLSTGDELLQRMDLAVREIEEAFRDQESRDVILIEAAKRHREEAASAGARVEVLKAKLDLTLEKWARERVDSEKEYERKISELERQTNEALSVLADVQMLLGSRGQRIEDLEELGTFMLSELRKLREASAAEFRRFKITVGTLEEENARLREESARLNDQILAWRGAALAAQVGKPLRERRMSGGHA